jgi:HEAT repeat protein
MPAIELILAFTLAAATTAPSTKPATKPATRPTTHVATRPATAAPGSDATVAELRDAVAQRHDPARRSAALARALGMLDTDTPAEQRIALRVLAQTGEIRFDRDRFDVRLRQLLASKDDEVRAMVLQVLPNFDIGQDDLRLIAPLAEDGSPRVRSNVASAIVAANGRVGSAELDAAMSRLLDDPDFNVRRESMRAINNVDVGPAVEAKLLALSHDDKIGRDAITLGLSTRPVVSGAVADRLIECLDDADQGNIVNRAAYALRNATIEGVARSRLDAALLRTFDDSLNPSVRENCITALARSPDPAVWSRLAQIAEDMTESDRMRDAATRVLK